MVEKKHEKKGEVKKEVKSKHEEEHHSAKSHEKREEGIRISKSVANAIVLSVVFILGIVLGYALTPHTSPQFSKEMKEVGAQQGAKLIQNTLKSFVMKQYGQNINVQVISINKTGTYYTAIIKLTGSNKAIPVYLSLDGKKMFFQAINTQATYKPPTTGVQNKTSHPEMDISVMAFCPFGNQVEDAIIKDIELFHNKVKFIPHYIIYKGKDPYGREDTVINGTHYWSLHGNKELQEDIREKIVYDLYGPVKWIEFAVAINDNCTRDNIDTCWKEQAKKLGINVDKVQELYNKEWQKIVEEEAQYCKANGITGSPTIYLNGEQYKSPRRTPEAFRKYICSAFVNAPQPLCNENETLSDVQKAASGSCN